MLQQPLRPSDLAPTTSLLSFPTALLTVNCIPAALPSCYFLFTPELLDQAPGPDPSPSRMLVPQMWACSVMSDSLRPPPGSSAHGIFQAKILEWVAISFSGELHNPGMEPGSPESPALAGRFCTTSTTSGDTPDSYMDKSLTFIQPLPKRHLFRVLSWPSHLKL